MEPPPVLGLSSFVAELIPLWGIAFRISHRFVTTCISLKLPLPPALLSSYVFFWRQKCGRHGLSSLKLVVLFRLVILVATLVCDRTRLGTNSLAPPLGSSAVPRCLALICRRPLGRLS